MSSNICRLCQQFRAKRAKQLAKQKAKKEAARKAMELRRRTDPDFPDHDQAIAGADLTVSGSGLLSYPGEGLVRDGLSDLAGAIHNI